MIHFYTQMNKLKRFFCKGWCKKKFQNILSYSYFYILSFKFLTDFSKNMHHKLSNDLSNMYLEHLSPDFHQFFFNMINDKILNLLKKTHLQLKQQDIHFLLSQKRTKVNVLHKYVVGVLQITLLNLKKTFLLWNFLVLKWLQSSLGNFGF